MAFAAAENNVGYLKRHKLNENVDDEASLFVCGLRQNIMFFFSFLMLLRGLVSFAGCAVMVKLKRIFFEES